MPGPRRHQLLQTSMQALRPGLIQMEASRNREKARVEAVTGGRQAEKIAGSCSGDECWEVGCNGKM